MFWSKSKKKTVAKQEKPGLYPVVYVADSLQNYQKELTLKEVESLNELRKISSAFQIVLKEDAILREPRQVLTKLQQSSKNSAEHRAGNALWTMRGCISPILSHHHYGRKTAPAVTGQGD